jgi:hypothetical protein
VGGPAARLRAAREEIAATEDLGTIMAIVVKIRALASNLEDDDPLLDRCIDAVTHAERRSGRLMLAGARAEISKNRSNRWQRLAQMNEAEFAEALVAARAAARDRRRAQALALAPGAEAGAIMVTTCWYRGADGVLTRFRFGLGTGDDPVSIAEELARESGLLRRRTGRAA